MYPLLGNDKLFCSHNGQVQLQSNMGKNLEVKGVCVITKSDLDSCDGWKYRGRGLMQLTGKGNFEDFQKHAFTNEWIKDGEDFVSNPELVTQSGKYALLSAAYFWTTNKLYDFADKDEDSYTAKMTTYIMKHDKKMKVNVNKTL